MLKDGNAAVYCRVSTKAQAEEGSSLESQERACRKLAADRSLVAEKVFKEDWPGDTLDRPLLRQLRDQLRQGIYAAVICHATDRLARKPVHLAIVAEECEKTGAELLFVTEPLDNSPEGQLIRYVKGYAAEIEREKIRERTMRGKRSRAERGMLPQGTGKGTYGYRYDSETGKRAIHEVEAEVVWRIYQSCAGGMSCHAIAVGLNKDNIPALAGGKWHPLTVKRVLQNTAYKGVTIYGQYKRVSLGGRRYKVVPADPSGHIVIDGATPPIVSAEIWERAQQRLAQPRRNPTIAARKYLLTGFAQCECGAPLVGTRLNRIYPYYRCRATWATAMLPKTCDAPYVQAPRLEQKVWDTIAEILLHPELVLEEVKRRQGEASVLDQEIERLHRSLRQLANQERRLVRLYSLGEIDDDFVKKDMNQIKKERGQLQHDQARLERQRLQLGSLETISDQVREFCAMAAEKLGEFTFEDKRQVLKVLEIRTVVGRSGVRLFGVIPSFYATTAQTWALPRGRSPRSRWA